MYGTPWSPGDKAPGAGRPAWTKTSATSGPSQNSGDLHPTVQGTGRAGKRDDGRGGRGSSPAPRSHLRCLSPSEPPPQAAWEPAFYKFKGNRGDSREAGAADALASLVTKPAARRTPAASWAAVPVQVGKVPPGSLTWGPQQGTTQHPVTRLAFSQTKGGNAK